MDLHQTISFLGNTPSVLEHLLKDVGRKWLYSNEGPNTWSPYEVIGHLIHGEKTDWLVRIKIILDDKGNREFSPFDRFAMLSVTDDLDIKELLHEFHMLRSANIRELKQFNIDDTLLSWQGIHPDFDEVTLAQLLSSWVVHDLNHIGQIARVIAKQFESGVGPWKAYLGILNR